MQGSTGQGGGETGVGVRGGAGAEDEFGLGVEMGTGENEEWT